MADEISRQPGIARRVCRALWSPHASNSAGKDEDEQPESTG